MKQAQLNNARGATVLRLRPLALALYGASLLSLPVLVQAQVVVATGNTKVYNGPNGVQVVDIATPNAAGLSHNVYNQFNVARSGMVLNNGDTSQITRQSQLTGQVSANMNLNNAAKVILNEVTSNNRSVLNGHVEVLGAKADVIIANQYGITCNGCGFINTPHVTLTTGVPNIDADGRLTGFRVSRGDILVSGTGLNGGGVDYLDLVARAIKLDGQVNATDLAIAAGASSWDYASRTAQAAQGSDDVPAWGIDSSALGGMYANRIRLMATEQGVGVRLLGDAAASAAELTLGANGQITVQSRLSAQAGNVALRGTAITVAGVDSAISAAGNIALDSTAGAITLTDASLRAGADLRLRAAGDLRDSGTASSALRFAAGTLDASISGLAALDGTSWGAGAGLTMRTGALAMGSATLYSGSDSAAAERGLGLTTTSGAMDLGAARLAAPGTITFDAAGALALGASARVEGSRSISMRSGAGLTNGGTVLAADTLALRAASIGNSGRLQASNGMTVAATGAVVNGTGGVMLANALTVQAGSIDNSGSLQASTSVALAADAGVSNAGTGVVAAGTSLDLAGATLANQGALGAIGPLRATFVQALVNDGTMVTQAGGAMFLQAGSIGNSGTMGAGGTLALDATGALDNTGTAQSSDGTAVQVGTQFTNSAKLLSLGDISILGSRGFAVTNTSRIQAGGVLNIGSSTARADLDNAATGLLIGKQANLVLGTAANSGVVQALGALSLDAAGAFGNHGAGLIVTTSDGDLTLRAASFDNAGQIESGGALAATSSGAFANSGTFLSGSSLRIDTTGPVFRLTNSKLIGAVGDVTIGAAGHAVNLSNLAGAQVLGANIVLQAGVLDNQGAILANQALQVDATGVLTNGAHGQLVAFGGALALSTGGALTNLGAVQADQDITLHADGQVDNQNTVQSVHGNLSVTGARISNGTETNLDQAYMRGAGALALRTGTSVVNYGTFDAGGALDASGTSANFYLDNSGTIRAGTTLALGSATSLAMFNNRAGARVIGQNVVARTASLTNSGIVQGTGIDLRSTGNIDNFAGATILSQSTTQAAALDAGGALTNQGTLTALGHLNVTTHGDLLNIGAIYSDGVVTFDTQGAFYNQKLVQGRTGLVVKNAAAIDNTDTASLLSGADLALVGRQSGFMVNNSGRIQAQSALALGSGAARANVINACTGFVVGRDVNIKATALTNSGLVQGDDLVIAATGAVTNMAKGSLLSIGDEQSALEVNSGGALHNLGTIQSRHNLALAASSITNANEIATVPAGTGTGTGAVAGGYLSLTSTGGDIANGGKVLSNGSLYLQSAGNLMTLPASAPAPAPAPAPASFESRSDMTITLTNASLNGVTNDGMFVSGGDLALTSNAIHASIANNGTLSSGGKLSMGPAGSGVSGLYVTNTGKLIGNTVDIRANWLYNAGTSSAILTAMNGSGALALSATSRLVNEGAIHADGILNLSGATVTNQRSAGMSANQAMHVTATGGTLHNLGALFSTGAMALNAATVQNEGDIDTSSFLTVDTGNRGNFYNYKNVHASGNLTVTTGNFLNQAGLVLPGKMEEMKKRVGGRETQAYEYGCDDFGYNCSNNRLFENYYTAVEYYVKDGKRYDPANIKPAQLLSEGNLTINYGVSAANKISLISGNAVAINASGTATAFDNTSMQLNTNAYTTRVFLHSNSAYLHYAKNEALYDAASNYAVYHQHDAPAGWTFVDTDAWYMTIPENYAKFTGATPLAGSTLTAGIFSRTAIQVDGSINQAGSLVKLASATPTPVAPYTGPTGSALAAGNATSRPRDDKGSLGATQGNGQPGSNPALPGVVGSGAGQVVPGSYGAGTYIGLVSVDGRTTVVGANGVTFTGPSLVLPGNPNGMYVVAATNNTLYLVETNPLFGAGSALGSNYLAQRLGFDPDTVTKRLGDANYEARLVRDQLVAQTNNFLLTGYAREADQMQGLMDSAAAQSSTLGLTFGSALTAEQAGNLTSDLVWMVEATVNGQKVLAPVVYLSASTRDSVLSGSVLAARDVAIKGETVNNNGGIISATGKLAIATTGDITNTSGTMRANTVALTSTAGSVVNQTAATFNGDDMYGRTTIGPTGTITASGALRVDAAKDVRIIGAAVSAGGNASIKAGNDIVLDTIEDKRADSSSGASGNTSWTRNEVDTKQVGATLASGGNLTLKSGNDITIAGSQVKAGGNVAVDAARDVNLVDRQDVNALSTSTKTSTSGFTTSGGSVGYARTDTSETTNTRTGTSAGSSITSGGDTSLKAGNTVLVRGSDVNAGGDLAVSATDVKLLAGQNTYEQTIDKKTTTTGMTIGVDTSALKGKGSNPSAADVARSALDVSSLGNVSVGLNNSTTTTHSQEANTTARVSTLNAGGKTTVTAKKDATFEGTQVNAGGDIDVKAANINMVEVKNTTSFTEQTHTTGLSISVGVDPLQTARKAVADNLYSGGGGGVELGKASDTKRGVNDAATKGTLTSFTSGGNITRAATETIQDQGSQINAAKDFKQSAKAINMVAATDTRTHSEKETTNTGSIGVSVDFAPVQAVNDLKNGKPSTAIGMLSGPSIGVDANYTNDAANTSASSTTARVGNITAGGTITSMSSGDTRMQGVNLAAGEGVVIGAKNFVADAAHDTASTSSNGKTVTVDGRVAVDAGGTASGSLSGGYTGTTENEARSNAVTGSITSGKGIVISTTNDATFEGTRIDAAKAVTVAAGGAVNMKAAADTLSSSSSERRYSAGVGMGGDDKSVNVGVTVKDASAATSTAVAGSVRGDTVSITSKKDLTLEGTGVTATKGATLDAGGKLNLLAATSTTRSDQLGVEAGLAGGRSQESHSLTGEAGVEKGTGRSTTQTGSVFAVGGDLNLKSGGATLMQGTQADAGGKVNVGAAGGVVKQDAVTSSSSDSLSVYAYGQVSADRKKPGAAAPAPAAPAAATPAPAKGIAEKANDVREKAGKVGEKLEKVPLAYGIKDSSSDSQATAVKLSEGSKAPAQRVLKFDNVLAMPAVQSAVQVNTALAGPIAQYGSQAAIPDAVKRTILAGAGIVVARGANVDALLTRTQEAGRTAAVAGLSSARLDPAARAAALQTMGLTSGK